MAVDNILDAKEIEICFNTNPPAMSEESSVGNVVYKDQEECKSEIKKVQPNPQGARPQVKSRYRGNQHVSSTHDFCKKCDQNDAVKPWKMVRRRSVEGSDVVKVETSGLRRHSLGSGQIPVTKLGSSVDAKRDVLTVKKKPYASLTSEDREMVSSVDGSSVKSNVKALKNRRTQNREMEKVSRIGYGENSKEKAKTQTVRGEDVKEKTVCVVESIIKIVQRDEQTLSEKKTMRSGHKSFTTPKRGYADLEANPKPERTRVTLAEHLNFKRGKVLEMKPEDSCEGKKVVLRHQNVEKEKKIMTLINNVIEETMIKLMKLKKTKVQALTGAFETVIQNTKKSQHIRSKTTTSKVSSFGFQTVKNKKTET